MVLSRLGSSNQIGTGVSLSAYQGSGENREREFCALQNRDTRFPDEDEGGPQKSRRGGQVASHIGYRDIGDPGSKEFVHLELANPVAPTG
jgi:hypothetical protein